MGDDARKHTRITEFRLRPQIRTETAAAAPSVRDYEMTVHVFQFFREGRTVVVAGGGGGGVIRGLRGEVGQVVVIECY